MRPAFYAFPSHFAVCMWARPNDFGPGLAGVAPCTLFPGPTWTAGRSCGICQCAQRRAHADAARELRQHLLTRTLHHALRMLLVFWSQSVTPRTHVPRTQRRSGCSAEPAGGEHRHKALVAAEGLLGSCAASACSCSRCMHGSRLVPLAPVPAGADHGHHMLHEAVTAR